jgi:hypothetical protein
MKIAGALRANHAAGKYGKSNSGNRSDPFFAPLLLTRQFSQFKLNCIGNQISYQKLERSNA